MIRRCLAALALTLTLTLSGCTSMTLDDFEGTTPDFRPEVYFDGHLKAWGVFHDRFGNLRRQFVVDIVGSWDGEELVLVEDFVYADGETEQRVWRIRSTGEDSYEGRADDVVGTAEGAVRGRAMRWRYRIDLPIGESSWRVNFDDWMILQDDEVLLNRAIVSKFGLTLGEVTLFFRRVSDRESSDLSESDPAFEPLQKAG